MDLIIEITLGTLLIIAGFLLYRNNQKLTSILEEKQSLNEFKSDLNKSISSAERIQRATLPAKSTMDRFLEEYFIFYLPKDIVSGDFYWFEYYNCKLYIAVADCTGHGVPGAMMSLICNNALLRALYDDESETTGELLNNTRNHVIENLSKGKFNVNDGMDISLCCIDFLDYNMEWSGANNPLWIIRNKEFIELKPNKSPVGKSRKEDTFTTHKLELSEDDQLYMFSDGYKDQFGGSNNKKFLNKRFKNLILDISEKPLKKQANLIEENLRDWMGNNPQIDDICVMGLKLV